MGPLLTVSQLNFKLTGWFSWQEKKGLDNICKKRLFLVKLQPKTVCFIHEITISINTCMLSHVWMLYDPVNTIQPLQAVLWAFSQENTELRCPFPPGHLSTSGSNLHSPAPAGQFLPLQFHQKAPIASGFINVTQSIKQFSLESWFDDTKAQCINIKFSYYALW